METKSWEMIAAEEVMHRLKRTFCLALQENLSLSFLTVTAKLKR